MPNTRIGFRFVFVFTLLSLTIAFAGPFLVVDPETVDLGTVAGGTIAEGRVSLVNAGDAPLVIKGVHASCSCLSVESPHEVDATIAPAGELVLPFSYDTSGRYGEIDAQILVATDDPEHPFSHVPVVGFIDVPIRAEPAAGFEWSALRGSVIPQTLKIWPGSPERSFEFVGAEVTDTQVAVTWAPIKEDGVEGVELSFTLPDTMDPPSYKAVVSALAVIDGKDEVLQVPFIGTILGDQNLSTRQIVSIRKPHKPGDYIGKVVVRSNRAGERIEVYQVDTSGPIRIERRSDDTTLEEKVLVFADHSAPGPMQEAAVYLRTTSVDEPVATVPVTFLPAPPLMVEPNGVQVYLEPGETHPIEFEFINVYRQPDAIAEARIEVMPTPDAELQAEIAAETGVATEATTATATKADTDATGETPVVGEEIPMERPAELPDALTEVAQIEQEVLSATPESESDQPALIALTLSGAAEAKEQHELVILTTNVAGFETIEIPVKITTRLPRAQDEAPAEGEGEPADVTLEGTATESATPATAE